MNDEVTIAMASFPPRKEGMLQVVGALLPQCDRMCLYLNGYDEIPPELPADPKLEIVLAGPNSAAPDKGSQGKHHWLDKYPDGYYLTVDDDIFYPADYVEKIVAGIERYGRRAIVTFHGTIYSLDENGRLPKNRPLRRGRTTYCYYDTCEVDIPVHKCGNGCSGFCPSVIKMTGSVTIGPLHSGDDEDCAIFAQENNVPIIRIASDKNWMIPNDKIWPIQAQYMDSNRLTMQENKLKSRRKKWSLFECRPAIPKSAGKDDPLVTISMTTYNTPPEMLRKAVDSILAQTEKRFVLVITNDAGDRSCWDALTDIDDSRVRRVDMEKNVGTYACHAKSLAECSTRWWSPHDSDDFSTEDRYAHLIGVSEESDEIILGGITNIDVSGKTRVYHPHILSQESPSLKMAKYVSVWAGGLWRTDWLRRAGGINPSFRVSYDTVLQTLGLTFTGIQVVDHVGYVRINRPDSLSVSPMTGCPSVYRAQVNAALSASLCRALKAPTLEEAGRIMRRTKSPPLPEVACART